MTDLGRLYLDPDVAGVPWLLDPDSPDVVDGLRAAHRRGPRDECDPDALRADLPDLLRVLRERHFGLATGMVADGGLDEWADTWRARLDAERPDTWGAALGTEVVRLRYLLTDRHIGMTGGDRELQAGADPRLREPVLDDDGPAFAEQVVDGVLCIRVRRLRGTREDERLLLDWVAAHERHFGFDRIIVDVRGNGGGNDGFTHDWFVEHLPERTPLSPTDAWHLDDKPLVWNAIVEQEAVHGADGMFQAFHDMRPAPHPGAVLHIERDESWRPAGARPWRGRMLAVTDRGTASSGESTAWWLRAAFGAKLVGARSMGCLQYGNLVPYLLARSGLVVRLVTMMETDVPPGVELNGLPLDVELDPRTPLVEIATDFDRFWGEPVT